MNAQVWLSVIALAILAVVYALHPILAPFLVGAVIAYLADPFVDRLEAKGLSRTLGVVIVFVLLICLLLGGLLLLIPALGHQLQVLQQKIPTIVHILQTQWIPWLEAQFGVELAALELSTFKAQAMDYWQQAAKSASTVIAKVTASSLALVAWIGNLVLIPVVGFYLLRDWDVLLTRLGQQIPHAWRPKVLMIAKESDEVLSAFIRGQLLIMLVLGVIYAIGLRLVGLELGLLIGFLAGLASVVPYLGVIVGIGCGLVAAWFQASEVSMLISVGVVFGIGQLLEGFVLTPLLVGDKIGMHPVMVIFVIMAGGQLFGFTGVLLALPVGAVLMVLFRHALDTLRQSEWFKTGKTDAEEAQQSASSSDDNKLGVERDDVANLS